MHRMHSSCNSSSRYSVIEVTIIRVQVVCPNTVWSRDGWQGAAFELPPTKTERCTAGDPILKLTQLRCDFRTIYADMLFMCDKVFMCQLNMLDWIGRLLLCSPDQLLPPFSLNHSSIKISSCTIDWLREPRDPHCHIHLQTSFLKCKSSFKTPILECVTHLPFHEFAQKKLEKWWNMWVCRVSLQLQQWSQYCIYR